MREAFSQRIDAINEWTGKIVGWLFIPFTLLVVSDVFTRYVLRNPWYYIDVNIQIMGVIVVMGAGYCLLHNGHVSMDVLVIRFSPRKKAILNMVLFPVFFSVIGALLWKVGEGAWNSVRVLEDYTSALALPIYPFKIIMVVGIFLLLVQGIANFIRDFMIVTRSKAGD